MPRAARPEVFPHPELCPEGSHFTPSLTMLGGVTSVFAQQLRQLGDIAGNPPRLVLGEQFAR